LDWNYDDGGQEERQLLWKAGERAAAKARVLAESVGGKLGPLYSVREERIAEKRHEEVPFGAVAAPARMRASGSIAEELGGLELAPKRQVTVRVAVSYLIEQATVADA
jgi:uncharacterized protein YggE